MFDDTGSEGPRGTFEIYKAEADSLYKQGEYRKSIDSYTLALELKENDKNCLVCRSKCYLQLGDMDNALLDAESSLSDDKLYHRGIYQKAQALYYQGDFEMALVFYHRGYKLRPELQEFRQGIQKAQEAIDNSVGSPEKVQLTTEGDLSYFTMQDEKKLRKKPGKVYGRALQPQKKEGRDPTKGIGSEKTIKQLLGELYGDRQYLEKLLKETDPNTDMGKTISTLVNEGLSYLDTRSDFWRQQKPMYARKHDRLMQRRRREVVSSKLSPNDYIIKELERIDQAQVEGRYQEALKRSQKCLTTVRNFTEDQVPNKTEVIANLYSCVGNAYLELGMYDKSLSNHQTDLSMGESNDLQEAVSRGLDNLGRVHARSGDFQKAIEVWERKVPMSKSPLESTWLYHEIGRCYLETHKFSRAKEYGDESLTAAKEAEDKMWQLQASVLIAQSEVKLGDLQSAAATFEGSLELAKTQGDASAEAAIQKAISEVNARIVSGEGKVADVDQTNNSTLKTEEEGAEGPEIKMSEEKAEEKVTPVEEKKEEPKKEEKKEEDKKVVETKKEEDKKVEETKKEEDKKVEEMKKEEMKVEEKKAEEKKEEKESEPVTVVKTEEEENKEGKTDDDKAEDTSKPKENEET